MNLFKHILSFINKEGGEISGKQKEKNKTKIKEINRR